MLKAQNFIAPVVSTNNCSCTNKIILVKTTTQIQKMSKTRESWICSICRIKAQVGSVWIDLDCSCKEIPYHRDCIGKWLLTSNNCPTCNIDVTFSSSASSVGKITPSSPGSEEDSKYEASENSQKTMNKQIISMTSEKTVKPIVARYQEYLCSISPSQMLIYEEFIYLIQNDFESHLQSSNFLERVNSSQKMIFLWEHLQKLYRFPSIINHDLWIGSVENCIEALISCDITESFKDCLMMCELWNRVYRNYKRCFDSYWDILNDGHGVDSRPVSLSACNFKFRDYVMQTSFNLSFSPLALSSSYNGAESFAYLSERKACEKYSKLEEQKIQNKLISPQQIWDAREAAKEALQAWQHTHNLCQTTREGFKAAKAPFLLERIKAWVRVIESHFAARQASWFYSPTIIDVEEFPYSTFLEEKLVDEITSKGETVVKHSTLIRTISSQLVLIVVTRDMSGEVLSRRRCRPTFFYIYGSDDSNNSSNIFSAELSMELQKHLKIEFSIKPDGTPFEYRLVLDYKPISIDNFEMISDTLSKLNCRFEAEYLRSACIAREDFSSELTLPYNLENSTKQGGISARDAWK